VPATEIKDDLARIAVRREELEVMLAGTKEEPVLLHPNMAAHYRDRVKPRSGAEPGGKPGRNGRYSALAH
jgi:hypothetical protein